MFKQYYICIVSVSEKTPLKFSPKRFSTPLATSEYSLSCDEVGLYGMHATLDGEDITVVDTGFNIELKRLILRTVKTVSG